MYSKKVMEHFKNPHNYGRIKNPDGVGRAGSPVCGDVLVIEINVDDGIIKDIKFQTFGCVAAIACSSIITDMVKGKTLDYAEKLTKDDVVKALGELPPIKVHCSLLAVDALHAAIKDFKGKDQTTSEEVSDASNKTSKKGV